MLPFVLGLFSSFSFPYSHNDLLSDHPSDPSVSGQYYLTFTFTMHVQWILNKEDKVTFCQAQSKLVYY